MPQTRMSTSARLSLTLATALVSVASALSAPAHAAAVDYTYDVCQALRSGASLAAVEANLEARGYSARSAGTFTGLTIRKRCPDQAAAVIAKVKRADGWE